MRATLAISAILWVTAAICQPKSTLGDELTRYQNEKNIKLSFDAELLEQISSEKSLQNVPVDSLSTYLSQRFPLVAEKIEDNYYIITLATATYTVHLIDSVGKGDVLPELSSVLINGKAIPSTVKDGRLIFNLRPTISDTVSIFSPGYKPTSIDVSTLFNTRKLEMSLSPKVIKLNDVLIKDYLTQGIDLNPANQSISIDVSTLPLLPGETDGDLFASLSALPGITSPDNRAGNLYIRGSATDQSYIMLDNIPIYSKGHYFGTISPYNPKIIDKVEVHRNGFHPKLGGRVGGAVEIKTAPMESGDLSCGIGANTLFAMGYIKAPLAKNKIGINLGARRSFPTSFTSPKLEAITEMVYAGSVIANNAGEIIADVDVIFEDYQAGLTFQPNKRNQLLISSIYTRSEIGYIIDTPDDGDVPEIYDNYNLGVSSEWNSKIKQNINSNLIISLSSYRSRFRANAAIDEPLSPTIMGSFSINTINDLSIHEEIVLTTKNLNELDFGLEYRNIEIQEDYKAGSPSDGSLYLRDQHSNASIVSPYVNYSFNNWKNWLLQLGGRINYYSRTNEVNIAPRVFTNWYATNNLTLKGSFGLYYQYLSQVQVLAFSSGGFDNGLWQLADNKENFSIDGLQSMIGAVWNKNNWVFDVESYFKTADNVSYYSANKFSDQGRFFTADHEAFGIDFYLRRKLDSHMETWLGYSISEIKVKTDTMTYDGRYSQPLSINTGVSYHKNHFKASLGWRMASGLNGNSIELALARAPIYRKPGRPGQPREDPFAPIDTRFPVVHFLDASMSYRIPETENRKWSATFGISLVNMYNQENLTDKVGRSAGGPGQLDILDRNAIGFAPNLMVTIEW